MQRDQNENESNALQVGEIVQILIPGYAVPTDELLRITRISDQEQRFTTGWHYYVEGILLNGNTPGCRVAFPSYRLRKLASAELASYGR